MATVLQASVGLDTIEEFIEKIPKHMQSHMTQELRNEITAMLDTDASDAYQEGLLVNTDLMEKYSTNPARYARAVKFATYLNLGKRTFEAFALSHPEKYQAFKQQAADENWEKSKLRNVLSLKGANFKKTRIVTDLLARSLVPVAISNFHHKQTAIDKLAELVSEAKSERIQMESADKLLTHLQIDKSEYSVNADVEQTSASVVKTLAGVLDKMVDMHQREKEVNPMQNNSTIIDGIVEKVTKG